MKSRSIVVLKVGGLKIQPELIESVWNEIANLTFWILCGTVHGGGPQLDQALKNAKSSTRVAG